LPRDIILIPFGTPGLSDKVKFFFFLVFTPQRHRPRFECVRCTIVAHTSTGFLYTVDPSTSLFPISLFAHHNDCSFRKEVCSMLL
jgi:hypothetical protein